MLNGTRPRALNEGGKTKDNINELMLKFRMFCLTNRHVVSSVDADSGHVGSGTGPNIGNTLL